MALKTKSEIMPRVRKVLLTPGAHNAEAKWKGQQKADECFSAIPILC